MSDRISCAAVRVADAVFIAIDQGRRNALVVDASIRLRQGDVIEIAPEGLAGTPTLNRRVQFVDPSGCVDGQTLVGLAWIDAGALVSVQRKVSEAMARSHYRLQLAVDGRGVSGDERSKVLTTLFTQLRDALGAERFEAMPAEALDQFSVVSVMADHDTRGLIVSLLNSFIATYATPETHAAAYECLERLEALRRELPALRQRTR